MYSAVAGGTAAGNVGAGCRAGSDDLQPVHASGVCVEFNAAGDGEKAAGVEVDRQCVVRPWRSADLHEARAVERAANKDRLGTGIHQLNIVTITTEQQVAVACSGRHGVDERVVEIVERLDGHVVPLEIVVDSVRRV